MCENSVTADSYSKKSHYAKSNIFHVNFFILLCVKIAINIRDLAKTEMRFSRNSDTPVSEVLCFNIDRPLHIGTNTQSINMSERIGAGVQRGVKYAGYFSFISVFGEFTNYTHSRWLSIG